MNMKLRYAFLIGMGVLAIVFVYFYVNSMYYSSVQLHVVVKCIGNSSQSTACYEWLGRALSITVQDSDLEQSPKLKEALVKSPLARPDTGGDRVYIVEMTPAEFDSMNRMLVNDDPDAAKYYSIDPERYKVNPTEALWPRDTTIVFVDYNGNAYTLGTYYHRLTPFGQG
jgi:hypothetical protein